MIGVVENMSYLDNAGERVNVFGEGGGEQVAYELGTRFAGANPDCSTKQRTLFSSLLS
jgi:ATP-binding protein involved in chromosome partitioning